MKFRMDSLHYALLAVVVLLAVYCGSSVFREGANTSSHNTRREAQHNEEPTLLKPRWVE